MPLHLTLLINYVSVFSIEYIISVLSSAYCSPMLTTDYCTPFYSKIFGNC